MLHGPPGANQTKTIVDAHSTAERRQMAVCQSADQPSSEGWWRMAIRTRCSAGFFFLHNSRRALGVTE